MRRKSLGVIVAFLLAAGMEGANVVAATYEVGPNKPYSTIGAVPWGSLAPGDTVLIHWRSTPYKEKWVINCRGTATAPVTVRGVANSSGQLPVIDGNGAVTPSTLSYWNEERSLLKIGGSDIPKDGLPSYIVLENLEIRGARPPYTFTGRDGVTRSYSNIAAALFIEKGEHLIVRNCILRDSAFGLFASSRTTDLVVEGCHLHGNGMEGSAGEHNAYTEANGILYQFNLFGPLRTNCPGSNLKDRSAAAVVRYNWIEGGNRVLELVDSPNLWDQPGYDTSFVYGNVLIKTDSTANNQVIHYGGDTGDTTVYRKGTLFFYNNTVITLRTNGTTLFRLSTNSERADCRNNILYAAADGKLLALLESAGILDLLNNWLRPGYFPSFGSLRGSIHNLGGNRTGDSPGFVSEGNRDYRLAAGSPCINAGTALPSSALPVNDLLSQYLPHQKSQPRPRDAAFDMGAFEYSAAATNRPPVAQNQSVTLPEDTPRSITLVATDPDGDPLTFTVLTVPARGSLSGTAPALTYRPNTNYYGSDSFTFRASDGKATSSVATVSLTITNVNDAPVAQNQSVSLGMNTARFITLVASDVDSSSLSYSVVALPSRGTLSGTAPNLTYRPNTNYVGSDSFTFRAFDGQATSSVATVSLTITNVNQAPVAYNQSVSLLEDTWKAITLTATDPDGDALVYSVVGPPSKGTLTGTAPNLSYKPHTDYAGSDSFTFRAHDGRVYGNTATVTITVVGVNDAPVAYDQSVVASKNGFVSIKLQASDVDNGALTYRVVTAPKSGTIGGTPPDIVYTPKNGFTGSDSIGFRANDGSTDSNTATVSITVK